MDLKDVNDNERMLKESCEGSNEMIKNKQVKELQKLKLQTGKTSRNGEVVRDVPAISLPPIVFENVKVAFLTRSLVEKLLEQPDTFEDKVKGAFVRVELPPNGFSRTKVYKVVQVTGVTKNSTEKGNVDVKLQALGIPNDISINKLSNAHLSEEQREQLRHELKVGQLKMPTIEELQQKAINLREDIIDDCISRELIKLQARMGHAFEKGRRQEYLELMRKKDQLGSPQVRELLLNNFLKVIADIQTFSEEILNEKQGKQGSPELVPNKDIVMDDKNHYAGSPASIPTDMGFKGNLTTSVEKQRMKNVTTPVSLTRITEENRWRSGRSFIQILQDMVAEEETSKGIAVKPPSANLPSEKRPLVSKPAPQQGGVVTPVHLSPTVMQQSNHQLQSSGGPGINGPVEFDNITNELVKDVPQIDAKVWGEYTDEQLLKFSNQYDAKMFFVRREIMRRFEKIMNDQRSLDAKRQKLEMNLLEANQKLSVVEDELKKLKVKMEEDAQISASKIRMMEEDAHLTAMKICEMEEAARSGETRIRKMEKDAESNAVKIRKMGEDAQLSASKIRKMEEDAHFNAMKLRKTEEEGKLSAAKIRKMEEDALLTAIKIRKMEEDAGLSGIKITKMEEDARLSNAKISKMEKDARLSYTAIRALRTKIVGMHEYQHKQLEEVKIQSAMEALSRYKRSRVFVDEVFGLLSPIYSAGWTDSLLEIKSNYLPDLDVGEFPRFDLNSWETVDSIYYNLSGLSVQHEHLSQVSDCVGVWPGDPSASTSSASGT